MNGIYDSVAIIILFPIVVFMGASGNIKSQWGTKISKFLGDISYPVYIIHYPLIYIYSSWVVDNQISLGKGMLVGTLVLIIAVLMAYGSFKLYDEPVRKWLSKKFVK